MFLKLLLLSINYHYPLQAKNIIFFALLYQPCQRRVNSSCSTGQPPRYRPTTSCLSSQRKRSLLPCHLTSLADLTQVVPFAMEVVLGMRRSWSTQMFIAGCARAVDPNVPHQGIPPIATGAQAIGASETVIAPIAGDQAYGLNKCDKLSHMTVTAPSPFNHF